MVPGNVGPQPGAGETDSAVERGYDLRDFVAERVARPEAVARSVFGCHSYTLDQARRLGLTGAALKESGTKMRWLGRWLLRVLVTIAILTLVAFAVDWTVYKLRSSPHSTVTVSQFLSVPLKGQKTEYDYLGAVDESCSVSLFPQGGHAPCWYLRRDPNQWKKV